MEARWALSGSVGARVGACTCCDKQSWGAGIGERLYFTGRHIKRPAEHGLEGGGRICCTGSKEHDLSN